MTYSSAYLILKLKLYADECYKLTGTTGNFTHSMLAAREEALQQEKSDAQYLTEANMVQIIMDIFGGEEDITTLCTKV